MRTHLVRRCAPAASVANQPDEGIGSPVRVSRSAVHHSKTPGQIERKGIAGLFVGFNFKWAVDKSGGVIHEQRTDATSVQGGIDEERVNHRPIHDEKPDRLIPIVHRKPHLGIWNELVAHQLVDFSTMFWA